MVAAFKTFSLRLAWAWMPWKRRTRLSCQTVAVSLSANDRIAMVNM